jgi:hypothetical protein
VRPTGDVDPAAQRLAQQIGGQPSVCLEGFGNREFDAVSDTMIAQTTAADSAAVRPKNFLNKSRRRQIQETLKAAQETGRTALFEFTGGAPAQEVRDYILRHAEKTGLGASNVIMQVRTP